MIAKGSALLLTRQYMAASALAGLACSSPLDGIDFQETAGTSCSINTSEIFSGGPGKDGIPALTNPTMVLPEDPGTEYLLPNDRVVGLAIGGQALAIPINILWWHEIVNFDVAGRKLAVTHCPLTGSSMVFDRALAGGAEFGVSGLLYQNNLIMYDRNTEESLWPQMARHSRCGPKDGLEQEMIPAIEMTWDGWQTLHPHTQVVSSETAFGRNYRVYPYDDYDQLNNSQVLFPMGPLDRRRPPKERVLGVPDGENGGRAYPYGLLESLGPEAMVEGDGDVIFWDSQRQAAMAYSTLLDGQNLTFEFGQGQIRDTETQSVWRIDGLAVSGPMAGRRLEPVADAYVAYWFAWAAFHPQTTLWSAP